MSGSFIHKNSWALPSKFADPLAKVQQAVDALRKSVGHDDLNFTLDGRFVGDLGEAIAAYFFKIDLNAGQEKGFDAVMQRGAHGDQRQVEDVEIKVRRKSSNIWFHSEPTHLIVFSFESCDQRVTLVYAGPGDVVRRVRPDVALDADGRSFTERQTVSLNQLARYFNYEAFVKSPSIPFRNRPAEV